jgi:predicted ATPase
MSDGTLRALGVLVALYQGSNGSGKPVPLVGIEEPEVALHPKALAVLLDALREASVSRQIIVTSHSPDLLDDKDLDPQSLFAVVSVRGATIIGHLDDAGRTALREHLYTAGDLLSMDMLRPATQQSFDL